MRKNKTRIIFNVQDLLEIPEVENTIVEMKFSVNELNSRVAIAEGKICNLQSRAVHKDKDPENAKEN